MSRASQQVSVPTTAAELREAILSRYDSLSERLQQFAHYVLDAPNDVALETLAVIAERSGIQPSAIVRFAKQFGFDGASPMQRLFRADLVAANPAAAYSERVRQTLDRLENRPDDPASLLREFAEGTDLAVRQLTHTVSAADLAAAFRLLEQANTVYVIGVRRAFPVAAYLAYSLQQSAKRTIFVDGVAGLWHQQVAAITSGDLLIGVSYRPYAEETIQVVKAAHAQRATILAITDSAVSPIAKEAETVLRVHEAEIRGFRSLAASVCLAQALVIGYALRSTRSARSESRRRGGRRTPAARE
ncbi:MAG: MurR/RpiR family transcriptional regulator [Gammaproteobacteria bacterium]|nr:MurR/RpiR family transcriptional regulator [Gammaproteobacteria bacterium]